MQLLVNCHQIFSPYLHTAAKRITGHQDCKARVNVCVPAAVTWKILHAQDNNFVLKPYRLVTSPSKIDYLTTMILFCTLKEFHMFHLEVKKITLLQISNKTHLMVFVCQDN